MSLIISNIYGRSIELERIRELWNKQTASLVVIKGRRRIGKSTLAQQVGRSAARFFEFQGLPPRKGTTNQDQLNNFSAQLAGELKLANFSFSNWSQAFDTLAKFANEPNTVILFDEISWMGQYDPDFAGQLKIAWDTKFKNNSALLLILSGSVSSWIESNILRSTDFVGRISLVLRLRELPIAACARFWDDYLNRTTPREILKVLSIFGGVPKYLEEYNHKRTFNENIKDLCFSEGGYLFEDFDRIFSDIFGRRSKLYKRIVGALVAGPCDLAELSLRTGLARNGTLSGHLENLEQADFIRRDYSHTPQGIPSKLSRYRLSDNYLRFYLKYIEPNKAGILANTFLFNSVSELPGWAVMLGLQFENLILNHLSEIIVKMSLASEPISNCSPHFQKKSTKHKACQIDLMISTRGGVRYPCEIKFRELITFEVVREMQAKVAAIALPRRTAVRPILIYSGELAPQVIDSDFFFRTVNIEDLVRPERMNSHLDF